MRFKLGFLFSPDEYVEAESAVEAVEARTTEEKPFVMSNLTYIEDWKRSRQEVVAARTPMLDRIRGNVWNIDE